MQEQDKMTLVKETLHFMVQQLRAEDRLCAFFSFMRFFGTQI